MTHDTFLKRIDRYAKEHGAERPEPSPLDQVQAAGVPLSAFEVLAGGTVFEATRPRKGTDVDIMPLFENALRFGKGVPNSQDEVRIRQDVARQLGANENLFQRMLRAKPVVIDVVPADRTMASFGYPRGASSRASGLFWDHASWPHARLALLRTSLHSDPLLVHHELAHAIHNLAFTNEERGLIGRVLRPTFGSRASVDEAFAIYTEREFVSEFSDIEKKVPGVYGFTRRQWDEDQLFTRFVRKLYFPHKPLAGPGMQPSGGGDWMKRLGRG